MASLPAPNTAGDSKSPAVSVQTVTNKETTVSPTETPSTNNIPPKRTDTQLLEIPFKFKPGKMESLSVSDHAFVCHAVGASLGDEANTSIHPRSTFYPPKGLPDGLYRDVIRSRTICSYQYYICMIWYNLSLFAQLVLGAAMTALASSSTLSNTVITILAAANTINAGLLALMHNSGLPDRYKNDWTEFEKVEMFMKELIISGIIREEVSREDIIIDCYERYAKARETVSRNKPSAYTSSNVVSATSAQMKK